MTAVKITTLFLSASVLAACAAPSSPKPSGKPLILADTAYEPMPEKGIPYPDLPHEGAQQDAENATGQLRPAPPKKPSGNAKNVRRLNDAKLKKAYLNDNSTAVDEADRTTLNETRLYEQAVKYYRQGNFSAAAAALRGADGGNGSEAARRNMYLLLQSQERMGNCESVIETGGRYANRFRGSPQAPDALFSIGQCQYKMQQKDIARNTWRKLIQTYPESNAAKRAALEIKQR